MSSRSSAVKSAQDRFEKQRQAVANMEAQLRSKELQANYDNANGDVVDTFSAQAADDRDIIDMHINDLKQNLNELDAAKASQCYSSFPQEIHHRLVKKWATCECPPNDQFGGVEVPKNIEHAFKTERVKELMSDPDKVQTAVAKNASEREKQKKTDLVTKLKSVKIPEGDAIYYELSSALRSSTFPGYSWNQTYGVEKSTYTNEVFKKAAAEAPAPDSQDAQNLEKYKYKADEFTRWRESFFIREQQAKRWTSKETDKKAAAK